MRYQVEEPRSLTLISPLTPLRFQYSGIGDGRTPDSAELFNIATYGFNVSEGPPVTRSAYSFHSAERATKEFRSQLDVASQIVEQGEWVANTGKVLGERALVINSTDAGSRLSAAVLLERDTTFFEVSSSCLRNVLEFEKAFMDSEPNAR